MIFSPGSPASHTHAATALTVSATDKLLGRTSSGAGVVEEIPISDFLQTLLDDADAATARATLGVSAGSPLALDHYSAATAFATGMQILTTIPSSATGSYEVEIGMLTAGLTYNRVSVAFEIAGAALANVAATSGGGWDAPNLLLSIVGGFVQITIVHTCGAAPLRVWATCKSNVTTASYFTGWTLADASAGSGATFIHSLRGSVYVYSGNLEIYSGTLTVSGATVLSSTLAVSAGITSRGIRCATTKVHATDAPTVNDDTGDGHQPGDMWLRVSTGKLYVCVSNGSGTADWQILN